MVIWNIIEIRREGREESSKERFKASFLVRLIVIDIRELLKVTFDSYLQVKRCGRYRSLVHSSVVSGIFESILVITSK